MTNNPLVEAVARAAYIRQSKWLAQNGPGSRPSWDSPDADPRYKASLVEDAIAALRAIEDAGWKVVPVEATPEMENAAYEVQVKGADLHDFTAHDCAKDIWAAMIAAPPKG